MNNEITTDIVEGQIQTAEGLLQWLQAEAEMTKRALAMYPLLMGLSYILGSIVKTVGKIGIDRFDPEHAGYTASKFIEVSKAIRVVVAGSDICGFYHRFPLGKPFKRVQAQGKTLAQMAITLQGIDEQWQATVEQAAKKQIMRAQELAFSAPMESVELFDCQQESFYGPSEDSIRAQFHRTANLHSKS